MAERLANRNGSKPTPAEARLLRHVLSRPGIVRGELVEVLGSASGASGDTIRTLLREGLLQTSGSAPSSGGRPAMRLTLASDFAVAFAHCACGTALRSAVVGSDGSLLTTQISEPPTASGVMGQIAAIESEWSSMGEGRLAGSALSLPGVPHPDHTLQGKAPWLFGPEIVDLSKAPNGTRVLTHAHCLLRAEASRDPALSNSPTLAVDLNDGASAVLLTPEGSLVPLNLISLDGPEWVFAKVRFAERIKADASRPDTVLGELLRTLEPCEAVREAEARGDIVANRIVDDATLELGRFLSRLVRLLRPENMIVSAWLFALEICRPDEVRRIVRRSCPAGTANRLTFRHATGDQWTHCVGAGLSAIDSWLLSIEQGRG